MGTVPRGSIPSISAEMLGLKVENKEEKALLVRVGALIDALIEAQRGLANAGQGNRRANVNNLKKPKPPTGTTENLFNAVSVTLDPTNTSANLSHQEIQIDTDSGFSNPTQKKVFANNTTFKGLIDSTTYNIRARLVTKDGQISPWELLQQVITTSSTGTADLDGDNLGNTVESKPFIISTAAQEIFCATALGFRTVIDEVFTTTAPNDTASQTLIKDREGDGGIYTDIELITLPGVPRTPMTDTTVEFVSRMTVRRPNPIIFFTLITPNVSSFPDVRTFDVQIADDANPFVNSTQDTVWVEF